MKIHELYEKGIRRIQLPAWSTNAEAYADISGTMQGMHPWVKVHDIGGYTSELLVSEADSPEWIDASDKG